MSDKVIIIKSCNQNMDTPISGNILGGTFSYFSQKNPNLERDNQDSIGLYSRDDQAILIVADGIGGHRMGDEASKIATTSIIDSCEKVKTLDINHLYQSIIKANTEIRALNVGAGTTLCLGFIDKNKLTFMSSGDSLGIHISGKGNTKSQTIDHSSAGLAKLSGLFKESEIDKLEGGNQLAYALGDERVEVSISGPIEISQRDNILISSDGLTANVNTEMISQVITTGPVNDRVLKLSEMATKGFDSPSGHPDDLSIILLSFGRSDSTETTEEAEK